jgi:hypothetical protein
MRVFSSDLLLKGLRVDKRILVSEPEYAGVAITSFQVKGGHAPPEFKG